MLFLYSGVFFSNGNMFKKKGKNFIGREMTSIGKLLDFLILIKYYKNVPKFFGE